MLFILIFIIVTSFLFFNCQEIRRPAHNIFTIISSSDGAKNVSYDIKKLFAYYFPCLYLITGEARVEIFCLNTLTVMFLVFHIGAVIILTDLNSCFSYDFLLFLLTGNWQKVPLRFSQMMQLCEGYRMEYSLNIQPSLI